MQYELYILYKNYIFHLGRYENNCVENIIWKSTLLIFLSWHDKKKYVPNFILGIRIIGNFFNISIKLYPLDIKI